MTLAQFFHLETLGKEKLTFPSLKLSNLKIKTDWNGQTYTSILKDPRLKSDLVALENATIRSVIITSWDSEDFLYSIFVRLNQGSLPLSPQELRQALKPGPFTTFIDEHSAQSKGLKSALHITEPDFRMRDVELLVRYLAFRFRHAEYRGNLKRFLDETCDQFNKTWARDKRKVIQECDNFEKAIQAAASVFGSENMFRKFSGNRYEARLNRAVFDVVAFAMANAKVRNALSDQKSREMLKYEFEKLCGNRAFRSSIEATTKSLDATKRRFGEFLALIRKITKVSVAFKLR